MRYEVFMIANAMAIAIHVTWGGREKPEIEAPALEILYPGQKKWIPRGDRSVLPGCEKYFDHAGPERQAVEQALKAYADAELDVITPNTGIRRPMINHPPSREIQPKQARHKRSHRHNGMIFALCLALSVMAIFHRSATHDYVQIFRQSGAVFSPL